MPTTPYTLESVLTNTTPPPDLLSILEVGRGERLTCGILSKTIELSTILPPVPVLIDIIHYLNATSDHPIEIQLCLLYLNFISGITELADQVAASHV